MTNREIARKLQDHARELTTQGANLYRARACRQAALVITGMTSALREIYEKQGRDGLEAIPGVGVSLGYTLELILSTGEAASLHSPATGKRTKQDFGGLPGVGLRALEKLKHEMGITTLEELKEAGETGRLQGVIAGQGRLNALMAEVRRRLADLELQERLETLNHSPEPERLSA